ncbi:uncharacterized protein LOC126377470 [Pectinophora gossypiella]|uniref:uncharacterized protein LOC126377470 n=1 Tax=Pectinophora gossypiella TaxID=13191 RepID=UPI00214E5CC8|nr:uncharacterized protein LOC126377470 [Pectinophora gossypiella]
MSIHGPGCEVPSRFIDLHPYTNWIESNIGVLDAEQRPRTISDDVIPPEPHLDKDRVVINYGEPGTMDLYFLRKEQKIFDEIIDQKEWQSGTFSYKCPNSAVQNYSERGYIYSWPKPSAHALITISYYDIFYNNVKCMKIKVRGTKRSPITFNTTKGFIQEDLEIFQRLGPSTQSKMLSLDERWSRLDYLKYLHIWLKVRVHWKAWYEIEFGTGYLSHVMKLPTSSDFPECIDEA